MHIENPRRLTWAVTVSIKWCITLVVSQIGLHGFVIFANISIELT